MPPLPRASSILPVIRFLRCPSCGEALASAEAALRCPRGHSFDVAREGYVNLLPGHRPPGQADTPAMVAARARFLEAGHYGTLTRLLGETAAGLDLAPGADRCIVDIGAGTGYHLARLLDRFPETSGLAIDISKHAAKRAARAHPRLGAVVADANRRLPVATGAAALLLCVFAPRQAAELHRILDPRGALLVATPEPGRHLRELIGPLGLLAVDPAKDPRLEQRLAPGFHRVDRRTAETTLHLSPDEVFDLVSMGPNAFHQDPDELRRRIASLGASVAVTASFAVSTYRPTPAVSAG
jgi:23S rRNA (guanine745-N1)-methyltransferase